MAIVKIEQPKIRVISQGSFLERFDQSVRIDLRNSLDDNVKDFWELLKVKPRINLDCVKLKTRLDYIKSANYLKNPEDDIIKLLADGTKEELDF